MKPNNVHRSFRREVAIKQAQYNAIRNAEEAILAAFSTTSLDEVQEFIFDASQLDAANKQMEAMSIWNFQRRTEMRTREYWQVNYRLRAVIRLGLLDALELARLVAEWNKNWLVGLADDEVTPYQIMFRPATEQREEGNE